MNIILSKLSKIKKLEAYYKQPAPIKGVQNATVELSKDYSIEKYLFMFLFVACGMGVVLLLGILITYIFK